MKEYILSKLALLPGIEYLQNQYVIAGGIIILAIILAKIVLFVFSKYLQKIAEKTTTKLDDLIFEKTKKPLFYLILVYGLKLSLAELNINGYITNIVNSLLAIVFLFIILRVLDIVIETWGTEYAHKTKTRIDEVLLPLFHKIAKAIFIIIGFIWILDIWQINIAPYLAGVGISGLVLGLALQDALKNIFGGITLLLDKTYQIGDKIKLESGEIGVILDIGLRSTKLKTYDNEVIYIPNGYLANSKVQNYTRPSPKIRTDVSFGVEYGSDIAKVKKLVLEVLKNIELTLEDPAPSVEFIEMGDFSLNFKARLWVKKWDQAYDAKLEATEKIYNALNKAKIGIAFPTQTIFLKK